MRCESEAVLSILRCELSTRCEGEAALNAKTSARIRILRYDAMMSCEREATLNRKPK